MKNEVSKALKIVAVIYGLVGYTFLFYVDWRLFIGVFLVNWGQNLSDATQDKKQLGLRSEEVEDEME